MLRSNFRKGQYYLITSANVGVNSAVAINLSISCTGPMMSLRMQGSMMMIQVQMSGMGSGRYAVNPTYSAGYIYASVLNSNGAAPSGSYTSGFKILALVASR